MGQQGKPFTKLVTKNLRSIVLTTGPVFTKISQDLLKRFCEYRPSQVREIKRQKSKNASGIFQMDVCSE